MPYGITQCYLPPGRGDIPAFTAAKAGTRFSDPRGVQGWVDTGGWLEMVYPHNGHPSWTNRARCWLTSLMRPTTLTTTPSRHPSAPPKARMQPSEERSHIFWVKRMWHLIYGVLHRVRRITTREKCLRLQQSAPDPHPSPTAKILATPMTSASWK